MKRILGFIGPDDWLHEEWENNGKKYRTMVPPRLGGTNDDPKKEWDGAASLRMAETMAHATLGHSDGEPYDARIENR